MTKENASRAIDEPRPVEDWENREAEGHALCNKSIYDERMKKTADLRKRQEAYEESLPKEPLEALAEISSTLKEMTDVGEAPDAVRSVLELIRVLACEGALDESEHLRQAVHWLAWEGIKGFESMDASMKKTWDISCQFHERHRPFRA